MTELTKILGRLGQLELSAKEKEQAIVDFETLVLSIHRLEDLEGDDK